MKNILIVFVVGFFLLSGCSHTIVEDLNLQEKEQAKDFSLKIVKTYFDKDCNTYVKYLAETLYDLSDKRDPMSKSTITKNKKDFCDEFEREIVRGEYSIEDYLESYNIRLLDKSMYEAEFPHLSNLTEFKPTANDYLFLGNEAKRNSEHFMWDDFLIFMVSNTDEGWKISAYWDD